MLDGQRERHTKINKTGKTSKIKNTKLLQFKTNNGFKRKLLHNYNV